MPQSPPPKNAAVGQLELVISLILRIGVVTSLLVVVAGTVVSFARHPEYLHSHEALTRLTKPPADFPVTIKAAWQGLKHGHGQSIVVAGLILLLATPVMRVAVSILAFVYEKDGIFVAITSIVLALLLLSFALGRATGG
jgi:uncharacterized membrane protein